MNIDMQSPEIQKLKKKIMLNIEENIIIISLHSIEWYCDVCNNGKNYTLRGKWSHLGTKKHERNYYAANHSN